MLFFFVMSLFRFLLSTSGGGCRNLFTTEIVWRSAIFFKTWLNIRIYVTTLSATVEVRSFLCGHFSVKICIKIKELDLFLNPSMAMMHLWLKLLQFTFGFFWPFTFNINFMKPLCWCKICFNITEKNDCIPNSCDKENTLYCEDRLQERICHCTAGFKGGETENHRQNGDCSQADSKFGFLKWF